MTKIIAKKSLGQNFLKCEWVITTMVHAGEIGPTDTVLEIGPGTGVLTRPLAKAARRVIAVEKDEGLSHELKEKMKKEKYTNVFIEAGDILHFLPQLKSLYDIEKTGYKVVANIPYYLTSRLLRILFEEKPAPRTIILTIQKEVAERLTAKPPQMNLLALSAGCFGASRIIKKIPASCFLPQPKIESSVIKITPHDSVHAREKDDINGIFSVAKPAFSQKRKTLGRSLKNKFPKKDIEDCFQKCQLPLLSRPQELSLDQWAKFVKCLAKK